MKRRFFYLKMNADGLEKLVGGISREEGHKHVLQRTINMIQVQRCGKKKKQNAQFERFQQSSHLIAFGFNHKGVWHQQCGFGFLDEGHRHHGDGDLGGKAQ